MEARIDSEAEQGVRNACPCVPAEHSNAVFGSPTLTRTDDFRVQVTEIVREAYDVCKTTLLKNRALLDELTEMLASYRVWLPSMVAL